MLEDEAELPPQFDSFVSVKDCVSFLSSMRDDFPDLWSSIGPMKAHPIETKSNHTKC